MPQADEAVLCIAYLIFDLLATVIFSVYANSSQVLCLFGVLTLVLGGDDAFHLVPRVIEVFRGNLPKVEWWFILGLMIFLITMTVFYVLLSMCGKPFFQRHHIPLPCQR